MWFVPTLRGDAGVHFPAPSVSVLLCAGRGPMPAPAEGGYVRLRG